MFPIFDLHCDLLHYLAEDDAHTPHDMVVGCSLPQLRAGGVALQTMALFSITAPGSHALLKKQLAALHALVRCETALVPLASREALKQWQGGATPLHCIIAVENASGLLEEGESLALLEGRLDALLKEGYLLAYVSPTWKDANRFGGGDAAQGRGLTGDGAALLEALAAREIALDLSHTSDVLLADILNYCDRRRLPLRLLASHSNSRKVCAVPRNLPDELLQELFHRGAVVGLHVVWRHVGGDADMLAQHLQRMLDCGGADGVACGFDYFAPGAFVPRAKGESVFIGAAPDASHSQTLLALLQRQLGLSAQQMEKLAWRNAQRFFS